MPGFFVQPPTALSVQPENGKSINSMIPDEIVPAAGKRRFGPPLVDLQIPGLRGSQDHPQAPAAQSLRCRSSTCNRASRPPQQANGKQAAYAPKRSAKTSRPWHPEKSHREGGFLFPRRIARQSCYYFRDYNMLQHGACCSFSEQHARQHTGDHAIAEQGVLDRAGNVQGNQGCPAPHK